jgi:hypothetical protein
MPSFGKSQIFTSIKHINFYLAFWTPFAFWEADLHKMKGRETLSISHNDLNTAADKAGLTESFSASTELCNASTNT